MKNEIIYNYGIEPLSIHQKEKNYYFSSESKNYLLFYCYDINIIDKTYDLYNKISPYQIPIHKFILTLENKTHILINNEYYVLLEIMVKKYSVTLEDVLKINSLYVNDKEIINWVLLWANKIDSFEYQLNQMGKQYPLLTESFSYYVGLAETAILLCNITDKTKMTKSLSHYRITALSTSYDLYNPFNIKIDLRIRDFCDYINSAFFTNKDSYKLVDDLLYYNQFSKEEKNLIFSRILFPTYYFDLYEKIIDNKKEEIEMKKIIAKVEEYEKFIVYLYTKLNTNNELVEIEWIKKIMQY